MYTTCVKSVHKVLKLHHHKHTGKLLAHKHTSYRMLFLLMLLPIGLMALIDQMAGASELMVGASVPAPIPSGAPVITRPAPDTTVYSSDITVVGTCPIITPSVIIAIYDNDALVGSTKCSPDGKFSVPVSLTLGVHSLVATVVTITGDTGRSSQPVSVTYMLIDPEKGKITTAPLGFGAPVRIVPTDPFTTIHHDGNAVWRGKFVDGQKPYSVRVDWGDGIEDVYAITDEQEQTFAHNYTKRQTSTIVVEVTDATGEKMTVYGLALTFSMHEYNGLGSTLHGTDTSSSPFATFIQKYIVHIYVFSLSALVFLWYLEHGRHIVRAGKHVGRLRHR